MVWVFGGNQLAQASPPSDGFGLLCQTLEDMEAAKASGEECVADLKTCSKAKPYRCKPKENSPPQIPASPPKASPPIDTSLDGSTRYQNQNGEGSTPPPGSSTTETQPRTAADTQKPTDAPEKPPLEVAGGFTPEKSRAAPDPKVPNSVGCNDSAAKCADLTQTSVTVPNKDSPDNPYSVFKTQNGSYKACTGDNGGGMKCAELKSNVEGKNVAQVVDDKEKAGKVASSDPGAAKAPDGSTPGGNGKNGAPQREDSELAKKDPRWKAADWRGKITGDDKCQVAGTLDAGCDGTQMVIDGSKVVDQVGQTTGSIATQYAGQNAQMQAAQAGTQEAALRGAAETSRVAGTTNIALGAVNAVAGITQIGLGMKHSSDSKRFKAAATGAAGLGDGQTLAANTSEGKSKGDGFIEGKDATQKKIIDTYQLNLQADRTGLQTKGTNAEQLRAFREQQFQSKKESIQSDTRAIANTASSETKTMGTAATMAGAISTIKAASQITSGAFALAAANKLDEAADKMKAADNLAQRFDNKMDFPGFDNPDSASATGSAPGGISGSGEGAPATGQSEDPTNEGPPSLGRPLGIPPANNGMVDAPKGGKLTPGGGGGPALGGGGGGGGGESTAAAQGAAEGDGQAKMAGSNGTGYESGGTYNGGGGGGRVGADGGPDLSGLLAQFLPKKEDEAGPKNGILDYGGRNPAGDQPLSLLDKNANIFQRIHDTYQDKNREGKIGL